MNNFVLVDRKVLQTLIEDSVELARLNAGGVDNWEGRDFAFEDFEPENELEVEYKNLRKADKLRDDAIRTE